MISEGVLADYILETFDPLLGGFDVSVAAWALFFDGRNTRNGAAHKFLELPQRVLYAPKKASGKPLGAART